MKRRALAIVGVALSFLLVAEPAMAATRTYPFHIHQTFVSPKFRTHRAGDVFVSVQLYRDRTEACATFDVALYRAADHGLTGRRVGPVRRFTCSGTAIYTYLPKRKKQWVVVRVVHPAKKARYHGSVDIDFDGTNPGVWWT